MAVDDAATRAVAALARTEPAYRSREEAQEVRMRWLAAIAVARRSLYSENQHLTTSVVVDALGRWSAEPEGREIVLILPRRWHGWLEQTALVCCQARLVRCLHRADRHGRLRLLNPVVSGGGEREDGGVRVRAKLLVVDDRPLRVGPSNITNRSTDVDTECDLAIDVENEPTQHAIAALGNGLPDRFLGIFLPEAPPRAQLWRRITGLIATPPEER